MLLHYFIRWSLARILQYFYAKVVYFTTNRVCVARVMYFFPLLYNILIFVVQAFLYLIIDALKTFHFVVGAWSNHRLGSLIPILICNTLYCCLNYDVDVMFMFNMILERLIYNAFGWMEI